MHATDRDRGGGFDDNFGDSEDALRREDFDRFKDLVHELRRVARETASGEPLDADTAALNPEALSPEDLDLLDLDGDGAIS